MERGVEGFVKNTWGVRAFVMLICFSLIVPVNAFSQSDLLREGIEQYKLENYEEAAGILSQARKKTPESTAVAFFLGLTYKQMMDYPKAADNLRDAVTQSPRIKDALVELVEVLYRLPGTDTLEEALKWIDVAQQENIFPAKTAFLKGLVLQKQGEYLEAIEEFERAESLDSKFQQSAEFQMAMCYMKARELKRAREKFQAAVQLNPQSDLAGFARQYQDLVTKRIDIEKPVRITLSAFGQYDSNVVLKPLEAAAAPDITDEGSRGVLTTVRVDYVPMLQGPWLFNAQYAASGNFHDEFSTSHDVITNGIYLAPGYNFGPFALNLALNYNHVLVRNPGYNQYLDNFSAGPLLRVLLNKNQLLEIFGGYDYNEYHEPPLIPDEDRDTDTYRMYAGWIKSFENGAFLNLKYEYSLANADGDNWSNNGHKFSLNTSIPLREYLQLQVAGQAFIQDYEHQHSVFGVNREDKLYQGSVGLTWEFYKNTNLIVQYSRTRADSNITIYDYERDLYTAGVEYRF